MKLAEARKVINEQMDLLWGRRRQMQEQLKKGGKSGGSDCDRFELSRELEVLDKTYEEAYRERERLNALDASIQNAEITRQQGELEAQATEERLKILEIFRRIINGDTVPASDEQKLMEYDGKMYMAAKSMSVLRMDEVTKEHDSLWKDEEERPDFPDPGQLADNTEVAVETVEIPSEKA